MVRTSAFEYQTFNCLLLLDSFIFFVLSLSLFFCPIWVLSLQNPFYESSLWILLFNSLVFRCSCLSFDLSSGVMSCLMLTLLNFVGAPLSLFKFLIQSFLIRGFVNSILAGLVDVDFILPKRVHLNDVSFPVIKGHKSLILYIFVCHPAL